MRNQRSGGATIRNLSGISRRTVRPAQLATPCRVPTVKIGKLQGTPSVACRERAARHGGRTLQSTIILTVNTHQDSSSAGRGFLEESVKCASAVGRRPPKRPKGSKKLPFPKGKPFAIRPLVL